MAFQVPTLNSLNQAVIVGQTSFNPQKFTDLNWIYNAYSRDSFTVYKGLLSLWNQRSLVNTPIANMTEGRSNVMYVPNTEGRFRYSIPLEFNLPEVVEDVVPDLDKPGLDGQPFQIKLNTNMYTNTDRIIADYTDGIELYITEEEIDEQQDGWIYTVQIVSQDRKGTYYPKALLQPGVQYMKLSNINGEYDTQKSSVTTTSGFMQLEQELGGGHRSVTHWITGYADMARVDESKSPQLAFINQRLENMGGAMLYANTDQNGKIIPKSLSWQSTIELLLRLEMEKMKENDLMWAKGGYVIGSGRRTVKVGTGMYEQLRRGNRFVYNKISLTLIESAVANLFSKSGIPVEQRRTKIMTGTGGIIQISKEIRERFKEFNSYLIQAKDAPGGNILYGDSQNAGFRLPRFTQYFSEIAGQIEFEVNPALDAVTGNRLQDSLIGQYPHQSYTYMILDVTDSAVTNAATPNVNVKYRVADGFNTGANVVVVKPEGYDGVMWGYINGTHSPLGRAGMNGMQSANHYDGYQIWMKEFASLWVRDVTRTLIIEKARPGFLGQTY